MIRPRKLLDFYSNPLVYGPIYSLFKNNDFKTKVFIPLGITTEEESHSMDFEYIYNMSGLKTLSVMLQQMLTGYIINDDDEFVIDRRGRRVTWMDMVSDLDKQIIEFVLKTRYLKKWTDLVKTLSLEYDALKPYQMEVNDIIEGKLSSSGTDTGTGTSTDSGTNTVNTSNNGKENIFGFNSEGEVPSNSNETQLQTDGNTSSQNEYNRSNSNEYSRDENTVRKISRSGNIGNHTAQELIEQQRELLKYQIMDIIYSDLDYVLTRSMYVD
jgi:hypothetical protein